MPAHDGCGYRCAFGLRLAAIETAAEAKGRAAERWTVERLAAALHVTALRNHNIGEGPMRAICKDPASHEPRAAAILAAMEAQG